MKNINKNSLHALYVEQESYLNHKAPAGFTLNGSAPFTIETFFTITSNITGILYGQEGGFACGLEQGRLYFILEGFCTVQVPKDFALEACGYYFCAVVFDGNEVVLYINGLKIMSVPKKNTVAAAGGDFVLGKLFNGYIVTVRLFSQAFTDSEILRDNAHALQQHDGCEFWADFTDIQYKDISGHDLALWRSGTQARCTTLTACTRLNGRGCYRQAKATEFSGSYTLIGKFLPASSRTCYLYSAGSQDKPAFSVMMVRKNDACHLSLVSEKDTITGAKEILPQRWCDFGIVLAGGKASLYLDGALDTEGNFAFEPKGKLEGVVGAAYSAGVPDFTDAFSGCLDYFAEFAGALDAKTIDGYADNPPYIFNESIRTLLLFGWGEPEEAVGDIPLYEAGDGRFLFVADTNPPGAEQGLDLYIPETEDPAYQKLSDDEKWALETVVALMEVEMASLVGMHINADAAGPKGVPLAARVPDQLECRYRDSLGILREGSPPPNPAREGWTILNDGMEIGINGSRGGFGSVFSASPAPQTFFSAGSCFSFLERYWIPITIGVLAVSATAALVLKAWKEKEKKRKPTDGTVKLLSISLNHQGEVQTGSMHFHSGENYDLPVTMQYVPAGSGKIEAVCVLVPALLGSAAYIEATVSYSSSGEKEFTGTLRMTNVSDGLQTVADASVKFSVSHGSVTVRIPFAVQNLHNFDKSRQQLRFSCDEATPAFLCNCVLDIYALSKLPAQPWSNPSEDYDRNTQGYVHTDFLDIIMNDDNRTSESRSESAGSTDAAFTNEEHAVICTVIDRLNTSKRFSYNMDMGKSCYLDAGGRFFHIKFAKQYKGSDSAKGPYPLNCADCASIVSSAVAQSGIVCPMTIITGMGCGFLCNRIQAISAGTPQWRFPFDTTGTATSGGFSFHQVDVTDDQSVVLDSGIYDACLKVDGGDFPGGDAAKPKISLQPKGLSAAQTDDMQVHVPANAPYTQQFYRERLVLDKQNAAFLHAHFPVPGLASTSDVPRPHAERQVFVDMIKSRFSIHDDETVSVPPVPVPVDPEKIEGLKVLSHEKASAMEESWRFIYENTVHGLTQYVCAEGWTPGQLLGHVLSYVSGMYTECDWATDVEGVERAFVTSGNALIVLSEGRVFLIEGPRSGDVLRMVAAQL